MAWGKSRKMQGNKMIYQKPPIHFVREKLLSVCPWSPNTDYWTPKHCEVYISFYVLEYAAVYVSSPSNWKMKWIFLWLMKIYLAAKNYHSRFFKFSQNVQWKITAIFGIYEFEISRNQNPRNTHLPLPIYHCRQLTIFFLVFSFVFSFVFIRKIGIASSYITFRIELGRK